MDSEVSCPISLYFRLDEGKFAEIETVAKSAIAFSKLVKEVAFVVDPSAQVEVELRNGREGSLSLESIIKYVKDAIDGPPSNLKTIGFICAVWIAGQSLEWCYGKILDFMFSENAKAEEKLTDTEVAAIAQKLFEIMKNQKGEEYVREIFVELEHDDAISGVGVSLVPGEQPTDVVPRSEFRARSGRAPQETTKPEKRTKFVTRVATLISPVLVNKDRKWRFKFDDGEFPVAIEDKHFLQNVLSGKASILLREGVEFILRMRVEEEKENGVWVVKQRNVEKAAKRPKGQMEFEIPVRNETKLPLKRPKVGKKKSGYQAS